jgi:Bardet-Biedl syndrome 2 protein
LVPDGVSSIIVFDQTAIYVGSNCALLGYDFNGNEVFWTVTGDIVTAMCELVWNKDKCLVAASADLMIRIFRGEESVHERRLKSKVDIIRALGPNKYVMGFDNGSVTVVDGLQKLWDVAIEGELVGLQVVDFLGVGKPGIIYSTTDGLIGVLDIDHGRNVFSDQTGLKISGLHKIDFKNDGHMCLLVISSGGSIRVFMPNRTEGLGAEARQAFDLKQAQPTLIKEKERLLRREYELGRELFSIGGKGQTSGLPVQKVQVTFTLGQRPDLGGSELHLVTNPPTPIHGAVIESKTSSGGDLVLFEANEPIESEQRIVWKIPDDSIGELKIDVFAGGACYTCTCSHQRFFGFPAIKSAKPSSYVEFTAAGSTFGAFVSQSFLVAEPVGSVFEVAFQSLETREPLLLWSNGAKCRIGCENIETAVRVVSEYCDQAQFVEFECRAHFLKEIEALLKAAREGSEVSDTSLVHKAEVAGLIAALKDVIVKIEDSEAIGLYNALYTGVIECERLNSEIAREHMKRMTGAVGGFGGNQKVNAMIQKFAELRKGTGRNLLLQMCRKELQTRDFAKLAYLLEYGHRVITEQ